MAGLFASMRNAIQWLGFDFGRSDGGVAQAVVLLDTTGNVFSTTNPVPAMDASNASFTNAAVLTVGAAAVTPGRGIAINCTSSGNVTVMMSGGSTHTFPVVIGYAVLPYCVTQVVSSTATAVFSNMS